MRINTWHFTAVITCWTRLYLYDPTVFFFITCDYRNYVSFNLCLTCFFMSLRSSEISLFWNLQLFYWHFLEILWIFIFIVFYSFLFVFLSFSNSHVFLLFCWFIYLPCLYLLREKIAGPNTLEEEENEFWATANRLFPFLLVITCCHEN